MIIDKIWSCGGKINFLKLNINGSDKTDDLPYETDYLPERHSYAVRIFGER